MDFNVIKEIGSAFLVGATALLVLEAYLYFSAGWTITGFFRLPIGIDPVHSSSPAVREADGGVRLGAFVGVATILGLLCQSAFQPLIDSADYPIHAVPTLVSRLICHPDASAVGCLPATSSKTNLRLGVFYEDTRPTPLTFEIARHGLLQRYCAQEPLPTTAEGIAASARREAPNEAQKCLIGFYYLAKNWAFSQPTLYDELSRIQSRIDFARAFSLAAISLLPWAFVFFFSGLTARTLGQWNASANLAQAHSPSPTFEARLAQLGERRAFDATSLRRRAFLAVCSLLFFVVGVLSMWAFDRFILGEGKHPWWSSLSFAVAAGVTSLVILILVKRPWSEGWPTVHRSAGLMALLCVILGVLHVVGYDAYAWEEQEFAKRAYGYFVTHHTLDEPHPAFSDGLRWFRDSAEKKAAYIQTYRAAADYVRTHSMGLKTGTWGVVLDIDETILDNSDYQEQLAVFGRSFDPSTWDFWIRGLKGRPLPGAREFMETVEAGHGQIVLVTNRTASQCLATEENLRAFNLHYDRILCATPEDMSDKNARFRRVLQGAGLAPLKVLAWLGDHIEDFPELTQQNPVFERFGDGFFVFPNPTYGSWQALPTR